MLVVFISLFCAAGSAFAQDLSSRVARTAHAGAIVPLDGPVLAGKPVTFKLSGNPSNPHWDLGDGATADGSSVTHTYQKPGIHRVVMGSKVGDTFNELSSAIVRVHTPETLHLPQVLLDTDARNEVDDQHYIAYALFSELDVLGINSIHHGLNPGHGGHVQEDINYGEILYIIQLARASGLWNRQMPSVFRGARVPLQVPTSGNRLDTQPVKSEASEAILAAARGASPDNPVWVLPVGPCTNIASAVLLAREEGLDLKSRIRIVWLGGGPEQVHGGSFNGTNDPWSVYVTGQSGVEFWIILENPTGASVIMDKRVESGLYPDNPLGRYLEAITPPRRKALYDVTAVSLVIGKHLGKPWLTQVEPSVVLGPDQEYRWQKVDSPTNVYIVRTIDAEAMKKDFFDTLNVGPSRLIDSAPPAPPSNTLGLENASGTRQQGDSLDATRFVAGSSFLADTMHARFTSTSASGVMRMAIYADNDGNPGAVFGDTAQFDGCPGLRSAALKTPVEITEGNVYWIATWVQTDSTTNVTFVADDGAGTRYRAEPAYSATDSFPSGSTLSYSADVTYAVYASGTED